MSIRKLALLCAIIIGAGQPATAAPYSPGFARQLDTLVPELMREYGARGVAVALIEGGKPATTHYYGYADGERKKAWSARTLLQPASVAKSITAVGVVLLAQDNRVQLNDPLFKHVRSWRLPPSSFPAEQVTIGRVLSHSGGLSRWTTGIWTVNDKLPTLGAALSGDNPEREPTLLMYEPGSKHSYSGAGYSLLEMLIEDVTGQRFTQYMLSRVFAPMGLRSSRIGWPAGPLANEATTYDEFGARLANYRTVELGAGGWVTTLPDLATFASSFARSNWGKGSLSVSSIERMVTPAPNANVADGINMGLGLYIEKLADGRTLIGHTGGNPGVGALFSIDPETGNGIAILLNRSWGHQVFRPIACAWRNATLPVSAQAERCSRDPTGVIMNSVASRGLVVGKRRFDELYRKSPGSLSEAKMSWMVGRFLALDRPRQAAAIIRWHPDHPQSAMLQEQLGDALMAVGDSNGARSAWRAALRAEPGRRGVRAKLDTIAPSRRPR